jgi:hypothetical protein
MPVLEAVTKIIVALGKLVEARGDVEKEEAALMEAEEALKAERDRRKFGS